MTDNHKSADADTSKQFSFGDCVRIGMKLCPIAPGSKGSRTNGWNKLENAITDPDVADQLSGAGVLLAYSRLCTVDIDNMELAEQSCTELGIPLKALLDDPNSVQISSSRPGRAKLLYRTDENLPSIRLPGIEFRRGTADGKSVQDCLPSTIHPDTRKPYRWIGDPSKIPPLPAVVLAAWRAKLAAPKKPATTASQQGNATLAELQSFVLGKDPDCSYDEWLSILMAMHHVSPGPDSDGFNVADAWSKRGKKYPGREALRAKWDSFHADHPHPITMPIAARPEEFDDISQVVAAPRADDKRFAVISSSALIERPAVPWLMKGVIPKGAIVVVFGQSGCGKSFAVFDMAAAIAQGTPWNGRKTKQGRSVFVLAEGVAGFRNRLCAYKQYFGAFPDVGFICDAPNLLGKQDHVQIAKQIESSGGADLIVIDTLAAASAGADENTAQDMGLVIDHCKKLRDTTGAAVLLIHHSGKDESKGARGWSGLRAAADAEIEVTKVGDNRTATVTKMKDGADGAAFGFKLVPVNIGMDDDGDVITSCVVEPAIVVQPDKRKQVWGRVQRTLLGIISDAPGGQITVEAAIDALLACSPTGTRRNNLRRPLEELHKAGWIAIEGESCRYLPRPDDDIITGTQSELITVSTDSLLQ